MKKCWPRKSVLLPIVAILATVAALICLNLAKAQPPPTPTPEKTEREVRLERELAECRAEVAVLRLPPVPPPEEEGAYLQSLEDLEQRIEQAQQAR